MQNNSQYEYFSFISYSRMDKDFAHWLHRRLESYRLPSSVCREHEHLPKGKLYPNFKDTADIQPNPLTEELHRNLRASQFLIVVASPHSAQSEWVGKEIDYFISLGRAEQIFFIMIDGKAEDRDPATRSVHPILEERGIGMPLAVDINEVRPDIEYKLPWVRREHALVQIISSMFGLRFDILWQRQKRRMIKKVVLALLITLITLMIFAVSIRCVWASQQAFQMNIQLNELSPPNANLPVGETTLELQLGGEWIERDVSSLSSPIVIPDIAAKYKGDTVAVRFRSHGFILRSEHIVVGEQTTIDIARDSCYAVVKGYVRDRDTDALLSGVLVRIKGQEVVSDEKGAFSFVFPLEKQESIYDVDLEYKGKRVTLPDEARPQQYHDDVYNTLYL